MKNLKNYMDTNKIVNILKNRKVWAIIVACFLFLAICLFIFLYQLRAPLNKGGGKIVFVIEQGQSLEEIAKQLKDEKLIRSKQIFILYTLLKGKARSLQAGEYLINPSMNIVQIVKKFVDGEIIPKGIKVTIPEGFSNQQIEERLVGLGIIFEDDKLPKELEGYLFPDTYYFGKDASIEEITEKMQDNFDKKVTKDLKAEIERQNKTLYDILIMASLLEKEVKSDEDRAIVSGIFWKRLENNYPLESCATIAYILDVDKWRYSVEETRIKSSYNTYLNIGLPPTPINNPGLSVIKAAVYPQETEYNFFLTDPETGATIFSRTLEEHNANKRKYF